MSNIERSGMSTEEVEKACLDRLKKGLGLGLFGGVLFGVSGAVIVLTMMASKKADRK